MASPFTTISTNNKRPWRSKFPWHCLSGRLSVIFIFGEIRFYSQRYFNPLPHKANNVNTLFPNLLFDRARRSIRKLLSECNPQTFRSLLDLKTQWNVSSKTSQLCHTCATLSTQRTKIKNQFENCLEKTKVFHCIFEPNFYHHFSRKPDLHS